MAKPTQKIKAQKLRAQGLSIKAIAIQLKVSKSSASIWCRDIILTSEQIQRLHQKMVLGSYAGRLKGARVNKERKEQRKAFYLREAEKKLNNLSQRELLFAGVALYWGEGGKTENRLRFYNSDPRAIQFILAWLKKSMGVSVERIYFYVLINQIHHYRVDKVVRYWCEVTGFSEKHFRNSILVKSNSKKVYENHDQHFGTLCVAVLKSSDLFYEVNALIKELGNKVSQGSSVG